MDYDKLRKAMEAEQDEALDRGDYNTGDFLDEALRELRGWLDAGAAPPLPGAVEKYVHLMDGDVETVTADSTVDQETQIEEPQIDVASEIQILEPESTEDDVVVDEDEAAQDLPDRFFATIDESRAEAQAADETEIELAEEDQKLAVDDEQADEIYLEAVEVELPADAEVQVEAADEFVPTDDLDPEQPALQMQNQQKQLDEAQQALESGLQDHPVDLTRSILLTTALISTAVPDIANKAKEIQAQANAARNQLLSEALDEAAQAMADGDLDAARAHYQYVRDIDESNARARSGLEQVMIATVEEISHEEIDRLRRDLKATHDIRRLSEAVYRAEAWDAEDRLTPELIELLAKARATMDEQKITMGQTTTMMRFGDLRARKQARDEIEERVATGDQYIFDATINELVPAFEVLAQANQLYEEASADTAQFEVGRITREQEVYPRYARNLLQRALGKQPVVHPKTKQPVIDDETKQPLLEDVNPFFEEHKRRLLELQSQVEAAVSRQEDAERLKQEAAKARSSLDRLALVLRAQQHFSHITGLQEQIDAARSQAVLDLDRRMVDQMREARIHLDAEEYKEADSAVSNALAIPTTWQHAEIDIPVDLLTRAQHAESLGKEISNKRKLQKEYSVFAERVRDMVKDPESRKQGVALFDQEIRANENYYEFNDYSILRVELEQYRDVAENLVEARLEAKEKNWPEVIRLCRAMSTKVAGDLKAEVDGLLDIALFENTIVEVKEFVRNHDISSADAAFERYKNEPERGPEAQDRLVAEVKTIEQAKKDSEPMQKMLIDAEEMARRNNVGDKLRALLKFRYIAGQIGEKPYPKWDDYKLSLVTSAAAGRAVELRDRLRAQLLPGVKETAKALEEGRDVSVELFVRNTNIARALRNADLLDHEDERSAARRILLEQGWREALEREALGNWEKAVEIWQELDTHYPGEVQHKLREARINQLLAQADQMIRQKDAAGALELLDEAQKDGDLARVPRLELRRADVYAALGKFESVFQTLAIAERHGADPAEISKRRDEFERERAIRQAYEKADLDRVNDPIEALVTLNNALHTKLTAASRRLQRLRDEIFQEAQNAKMAVARTLKESGTVEDKIEAVVALVDLSELEELAGIPEHMRRADKELEPLREQLKPGAEQVIREAEGFRPRLSLEESLRQATELKGRLETFSTVIPLFDEELAGVEDELNRNREDIGRHLAKLRNLKELLEDANQLEYWTAALQRDNFEPLILKQRLIEDLRMNDISEVNAFNEKLAEWQDLHTYLRAIISRVKQDFNREEVRDEQTGQKTDLFIAIRDELVQLTVRPDTIFIDDPYSPGRQNARSLLYIQDSAYQHIRRTMSPKLAVSTYDDRQLVGWDEVEEGADERAHEAALWLAWAEACRPALRELELAVQAQQARGGEDKPFNVQRGLWLNVEAKAEMALELLENPPVDENGDLVPVRSRRAARAKAAAEKQASDARRVLTEAELFINQDMMQFPTAEEFSEVAKTVEQLRSVLQRAVEMGPTPNEVDPDLYKAETARITTYKKILHRNEEKRDKSDGFFNRIFGR